MKEWFLLMMPLGKRANANYGYSGIFVETEHKKNERRSNKIFAQRNLKNRMRIPKINSFTSFDVLNIIYQRLKIFKIFLLYLILFGYLNFGNGILQIE